MGGMLKRRRLVPAASRASVSSQRRGARGARRALSGAALQNNPLRMRTTPPPPPSVSEDEGERRVAWGQMTTLGNSLTIFYRGKGATDEQISSLYSEESLLVVVCFSNEAESPESCEACVAFV